MNDATGDGWEGPRRKSNAGRKRVPDHVRLDKPARLRFSQDDLDMIGQAMLIDADTTGEFPVFSSWVRDAVVNHARRIVYANRRTP